MKYDPDIVTSGFFEKLLIIAEVIFLHLKHQVNISPFLA